MNYKSKHSMRLRDSFDKIEQIGDYAFSTKSDRTHWITVQVDTDPELGPVYARLEIKEGLTGFPRRVGDDALRWNGKKDTPTLAPSIKLAKAGKLYWQGYIVNGNLIQV